LETWTNWTTKGRKRWRKVSKGN